MSDKNSNKAIDFAFFYIILMLALWIIMLPLSMLLNVPVIVPFLMVMSSPISLGIPLAISYLLIEAKRAGDDTRWSTIFFLVLVINLIGFLSLYFGRLSFDGLSGGI